MKRKIKISLVINILIALLTVFSIVVMMSGIKLTHGAEPVLETTKFGVFKFFTIDSNVLMGVIALLFALDEIRLLNGRIKDISNKMYILKLVGTTAVSITFVTVFAYLGPISKGGVISLLQNSNLFLHLIIPVLSIIVFVLFERTNKLKIKDSLFGMVPVFLYEIFYLINILIHMENGKISPLYDWYWFLQNGVWTAVIVAPFMLLISYLFSLILWRLNYYIDLNLYDDKCIRLTTKNGEVLEGVCMHNSIEYNFHEFGIDEEGVQFPGLLIRKSEIKEIESLENNTGPYGHYSAPYGQLEELLISYGDDIIEEVLFSEDDDHVLRLLLCLDKNDPEDRKQVINMLRSLIKYNDNKKIKNQAKKLIKKWN